MCIVASLWLGKIPKMISLQKNPNTIQANINSGTKLQLETHFRKMILHVLYVSESSKLVKKGKNFQAIFKVASGGVPFPYSKFLKV